MYGRLSSVAWIVVAGGTSPSCGIVSFVTAAVMAMPAMIATANSAMARTLLAALLFRVVVFFHLLFY